ncbi:hypothetical protein [Sediminibacillus halophilus]|uniref:Uncharacterized protein n=1 Tax=Sediminibacillus halophilus TaxID=482461 RepID=A0A1G9UDI0_9BACI|nr:hypothetical protein [Sediminibacillus halophilus]SDM57873.1 hypothetical protein SAMN05216244_2970 [Sediminibacillus halophilus]
MGVFFQDTKEKSTKTMMTVRTALAIMMVILLISCIINGFDFVFLRLIFLLAGIGSILDGVESHLQSKKSKVFLIDSGTAAIWFLLAFGM